MKNYLIGMMLGALIGAVICGPNNGCHSINGRLEATKKEHASGLAKLCYVLGEAEAFKVCRGEWTQQQLEESKSNHFRSIDEQIK